MGIGENQMKKAIEHQIETEIIQEIASVVQGPG